MAAASGGGGAVYNVRVVSDSSPDLTDLGSLVSSITAGWPTDREKVWALYYWSHILKRQTPPMLVHGFEVSDPVRNFADYGFTDCSTITGINQALYEVIGLRHQFWDICNHTVSQVEYDGSFHMVDSSMSNLVTSDDGSRLATVEEVAADNARLLRTRSLYASSPAGFLTGADGLRNLVATMFTDGSTLSGLEDSFCAAGLKLRDYTYGWDAGHRYVLNLKDGESYTRYYRKLGDSPEYFVGTEPADAPDPSQQFDPEAASNIGVRANGRWSFTPDLSAGGFTNALYSSSNLAAAGGGGLRASAPGQPGVAIYKVQAGNVITSQRIQATFEKSDPRPDAEISISRNHGRRWQTVAQLGSATGGAIALDIPLRDQVGGAYEVLIRIQMTAPEGASGTAILRALTVETITQVNAKALPTLTLGRNEIYVGEGDQTDTMVLWPELRGDRWQDDAYDFQNIASQPVTLPQIWTAVVSPADVNQDAYLTYRMDAPNDITRMVYGGRLQNYFDGSYIDYLHSFDGGATWIRSYHFDDVAAPWDVIHYETVTDVPPGTRTVLFKFVFHSTGNEGGRASGLYAARMEADHLPVNGGNAPLDVTWQWAEVQGDRTLVERSHTQRITSFPVTYVINVGGADHPVMRSIRVNLEGSDAATQAGYADGSDAGGEKYVHRWRTDGLNLAQGRPYTVSRRASGFQDSAADGDNTLLTDGVVGGSITGGLLYRWGACWDSGEDVDITIDLGNGASAGAFRGHIFGWPDWDALKGEVQDRVEVLTSLDGVNFQSQGLLQTSLWKKDVPINFMLRDDETASAWNFELQPDSPVGARYVRYHITPARDVCVSELQVLDRVTYSPFDIRLSLPSGGVSSATWPFTVAPAAAQPPAAAGSPAPVDGATGVGTALSLTWSAPGATAYDVSFGTTNPPPAATIGQTNASYPTPTLEGGTTYYWRVVARNANGVTTGPVWSFSTADNPPPPTDDPPPVQDVVVYAADVPASAIHGAWNFAGDPASPRGIKLATAAGGASNTAAPLASPVDYVDVPFSASGGVPYTVWLRLAAVNNAKASDSLWVQFSDASVQGAPGYGVNSTSALLVNLATDSSAASNNRWGWANDAYWMTQPATVTFASGGLHTLRVQVREAGVAFDQVVLSPATYLNAPPGGRTDDRTIVAKPAAPPVATPPPPPSSPSPADAAGAVGSSPALTWSAPGATSYDVRFGTTTPPPQATVGQGAATYAPAALASGTRYFWQVVANNSAGSTPGPIWSFTTASEAPASEPADIVVYASDIPASSIHGMWTTAGDATSPNGIKLITPITGWSTASAPLAAPVDYFDVSIGAEANTPYTIWLRLQATNNSKASDSVWLQFSDAQVNGSAAYPIGTSSGLLVKLASDSTGSSDNAWGWVNGAYWLAQQATVSFPTSGIHTVRVQVRFSGVQVDQIVLSPLTYMNAAAACPNACASSPGTISSDRVIVPKPVSQPQAPAPPAVPGSPVPADGSVGSSAPTLTWASSTATSYDVYFGVTNPPPLVRAGAPAASYSPGTLASAATYFWQVIAHNAAASTAGPVWMFTTPAAAPAASDDVVIYAGDIAASSIHGAWAVGADSTSPNGVKLTTRDNGVPSADAAAAPVNYVDVVFDADAATPYTLWMRMQAAGNSKYNDSLWVQFSDALLDGAAGYRIGSTSALLVNLATDASGTGVAGWGWVNGAYWLDQRATVTFATSGPHTIRVQVREDGVEFDQIVLSRGSASASCPPECSGAPGPVARDQTIVPKP